MSTHLTTTTHHDDDGRTLATTTTTTTATTTSSDSFQAWHVFSLLISLGRPTSPPELASFITLFPSSPDHILQLCRIPNSPIHLTSDLLVTLSANSLVAIGRFLSQSDTLRVFRAPLRIEKPWFRKRKRSEENDDVALGVSREMKRRVDLEFVYGGNSGAVLPFPVRIRDPGGQIHMNVDQRRNRSFNIKQNYMLDTGNTPVLTYPLLVDATHGQSTSDPEYNNVEGDKDTNVNMRISMARECVLALECQQKPHYTEEVPDTSDQEILNGTIPSRPDLVPDTSCGLRRNSLMRKRIIRGRGSCEVYDTTCQMEERPNETIDIGNACKVMDATTDVIASSRTMENSKDDEFYARTSREIEKTSPIKDAAFLGESQNRDSNRKVELISNALGPPNESQPPSLNVGLSDLQKAPTNSQMTDAANQNKMMAPRMPTLNNSIENKKDVQILREKEQLKKGRKSIYVYERSKHGRRSLQCQEKKDNAAAASSKDQKESKNLPDFESYLVEEEEGSGGYGTVYRARRKVDGTTVAIKCPHENAHKNHVSNELKMLERFGGKNFIIRYEGFFKNGSSDCFVLEHVEHDRPEILKKEIDVLQLQWYGYCLFRALASLHKQGIVHRDVKPGNFLFSRKANKGYLIDFNLAMDLHQKYGVKCKSKFANNTTYNSLMPPNDKSLALAKSSKFPVGKSSNLVKPEEAKGSKVPLHSRSLRRKGLHQMEDNNDLGSRNTIRSQGGDGSGITSAKDATSTRTPSAERLREPIPCQGRKALISLVHEVMHTNYEASSVPSPMRKRVAAPPAKADGKLLVITPMPLHSTAIDISGAGSKTSKGEHRKEGTCVGTKGFRAPEVLFRSLHQGAKLDIWSAGVTMLYLVLGKMPFFGDPEQNIKDIAKLRGSEDLWEVAKIHNRESSFPSDLHHVEYLASTNLREWCAKSTKRLDFVELLPISFFDLVDKCLTVNPRRRISAEDALKHEFFAPCYEELKKHRQLRQGVEPASKCSRLALRPYLTNQGLS